MGTTLFSRSLSFWLDEEPERQEPLAGERPEGLTDLDWLDYQSSFNGEKFPVETLPSGLPAWLRLARRWEKKFSVPLREAGELAKTFIEKIWGRQPTPDEINELEASYANSWTQLSQGIKTLVQELEQLAPEEEPEVAGWVLTHGNYEKMKILLAPPEESEEKEESQAGGPAWRYLPVRAESEDWPCDEAGSECPLESLRRAKSKDKMFSAFRRLRASELPQPCREQLFVLYRNRKNFFFEEVPKIQKAFFEEKIKAGMQGKELYSRLKRAKMPSKVKSELWELWFRLN
ncbi:MAG: hypothetical protein QW561_01960, partial [Candidatus Aenigmatarchaeota archaeon]